MSLESWNKDNFDEFHPQKETIFSDVPPDRTAVDNILRLNYTNQLRLTLILIHLKCLSQKKSG